MFKRTHYIALVLVVLVAGVLLGLPGQTVGKFKLTISGLYLPFFGATASARALSDQASYTFSSKRELIRLNEKLRQENQQLRFQLQQYAQSSAENARLRQLLGWQKQNPLKLKLGRVVGRDPANWWRTVQIDLGGRDGVRTNQAVVICDGVMASLVGRILTVGSASSQVVLLGDPNLRVPAEVKTGQPPENGEKGIILPGSGLSDNIVDLGFLSGTSVVRPGQDVVTSGEGGPIPKGISIGKIVDSRSRDFGLSTEARVRLAANLGVLEEVWVVLQ